MAKVVNLKVGQSAKIMGEVKFKSTPESGIIIGELVVIRGPVEIGAGTVIKDLAFIGPNTLIGEGCIIGPHAVIGDTTYRDVSTKFDPDDVYTEKKPVMTVLGDNVVIGANTTVKEGAYLERNTIILEGGTDIETKV